MTITRRAALAIGLTGPAMALMAVASRAVPRQYGPDEGKEIQPGVRLIELGSRPSHIPAYKTVQMLDIVYQPGGSEPVGEPMEADMVCQTIVGELEVTVGDEKFTTKEGDVWTCAKGSTREGAKNNGSDIAIMRVVLLQA
jgi:quercetin dioxygenase-like cupin family protein